MILKSFFFYVTFLPITNSHFQINLHLTDGIPKDENLQHDCLYIPTNVQNQSEIYQIISYCMTELSSKFHIKENNIDQKLIFKQLAKQKVTSEQLYEWSASIDLIENYQFYLNQIKNEKKSLMETQLFYNCTLPYFGAKCQYVFINSISDYSSLDTYIHDYYHYNRYEPTLFTCYIHLECNRDPYPSCLDWTEICDGRIDCLDGGYDEEHCWQLEIYQCNENEYKCSHGQCVPFEFVNDDEDISDCIDKSDELYLINVPLSTNTLYTDEPTFQTEDVLCTQLFSKASPDVLLEVFLTYSCIVQRHILLSQALFSMKPYLISNECWTAIKCMMAVPIRDSTVYSAICEHTPILEIFNETCPDLIDIPAVPIIYDHIYLVYNKNMIRYLARGLFEPNYVCYDDRLLYIPNDNNTFLLFNRTCRLYRDTALNLVAKYNGWLQWFINGLYRWLDSDAILIDDNSQFINSSVMYKCLDWPKYISKHRLINGYYDCHNRDDEDFTLFNKTCSAEENPNYFKCITTNECIPKYFVGDERCHCATYDHDYCDDEDFGVSYTRHYISFSVICDGFTQLSKNFTEEQNETDETNCEHWPLVHIYNHCDNYWHNPDGSDEVDCYETPLINCSINHHICVSPITNQLICLPIEKANDGIVDCLGAHDEPAKYPKDSDSFYHNFYCNRSGSTISLRADNICDHIHDCDNNDDERTCTNADYLIGRPHHGICVKNYELYGSDIIKILCRHFAIPKQSWRKYFTFDQHLKILKENDQSIIIPVSIQPSINRTIQYYQPRCHRGLDLQVWLDKPKNLTTYICLCPPTYYGSQCQYQNQRISLTLKFRVTSDSIKIPFIIIISLIDDTDERIIHSSQQLIYFAITDCPKKYNIYLLYSSRPKNSSREYSIHIDIYEKLTLNYRASIIKTFNFLFLPVHRLAYYLFIPHSDDYDQNCQDNQCIHGKCLKYYNDTTNRTFCQCNYGWTGKYCTIKYDCQCSTKALCLGQLANNRSLCVCPFDKTGLRCLINDDFCLNNNKTITCYNNGKCVPVDEYGIVRKKFLCICPKGFFGDQCEIVGTKFILLFDENLNLPSSIRIHFIEIKINESPVNTTTFKTIPFGQDSIILYWSLPFHIVFVELTNKTYYLIDQQRLYKSSTTINKTISSSDECSSVNRLFNQTIANLRLLRRIKYYHLLCQTNSSCFSDEQHICLCQNLCNQQRVANCFDFNHNATFDCGGQSGCLHDAQCYQDSTKCPRKSICQCPICYYGTRCQFTTNGYSLSLDAILGYHIQQNIHLVHQPLAVIISLIITIIIILLGFLNGILCLITFKNPITRKSGSGIYLLCSSIVTIITIIIFILKYFILLFTQIKLNENRLFLVIQCHSIDFLLRCCILLNEWLITFVAIERTLISKQGIRFNKNKSKLLAKRIISILILLIILSNVFDPIYRSLFDEYNENDDEKRIWCIVKYPSAVRIITLIITVIHSVVPFIINIISAIIIILVNTRQQAIIHDKKTYGQVLKKQIHQHRSLLIGPCVLVILGIPRLIISFASGCMKSSKHSWLFLLGYCISFIPTLLTFTLFVLPSSVYKRAFKEAVSHYRNLFRRHE